MKNTQRFRLCLQWIVWLCLMGSLPAGAASTFYIDESLDFSGNGCQNADLNDVTSQLCDALRSAGWAGTRWVDANAWPQDFIESCSPLYGAGGLDSIYADAALLSVYAGHGNKGLLQWGYPRDGVCTIDFSKNMRLGAMSGAASGFGIYITSCTLHTSSLVDGGNWQWLRQQFGYHNSPSVHGDGAKNFFNGTGSKSNKNSWLGAMEDRPGWFTGDNSPIVVSYGATASEALAVHNDAALKRQIYTSPRPGGPGCGGGQPLFYYVYTFYDHGDGGCR
ncbi:MAG TPA: hypothetical protein VGG03_08945 [Thermoanaerobaculia bacterium]|jgi:hypothetical protein